MEHQTPEEAQQNLPMHETEMPLPPATDAYIAPTPKPNYWQISTLVLAVILVCGGLGFKIYADMQPSAPTPTQLITTVASPIASASPSPVVQTTAQKTNVGAPVASPEAGQSQLSLTVRYGLDAEAGLAKYSFIFPKKYAATAKTISGEVGSMNPSGIQFKVNGATLEVYPSFEGTPISYVQEKPDVKLIRSSLSFEPLFRITPTAENPINSNYWYVSGYSEKCDYLSPVPKACHMSSFFNKDIGLDIQCKATAETVKYCDEIVENLTVNLEKLAP